jgi:hypothetical protein
MSPSYPDRVDSILLEANCTLLGQTATSDFVRTYDPDTYIESSDRNDTGYQLVKILESWDGTAPDMTAEFTGELNLWPEATHFLSVGATFGATLYQMLPYWTF